MYKPGGSTIAIEQLDSIKAIIRGKGSELKKYESFVQNESALSVQLF
jgi:hypothetical protein